MTTFNFIGWIRDTKGLVLRYNLKQICNTITSFSGGVLARIPIRACITPLLMS